MHMSELHGATMKAKPETAQSKMASCSSDVSSFMPDHEFVELLWENGQIVMQGQSHKPKRSSYPTFFASGNPRIQEKDGRDPLVQKFSQFEDMDSATANELSPAVPCANIGLNSHDDVMNPWINYPMEDPLCSELFSELAGINPNPPSTADRNSGFAVKDFHSGEIGHSSKSVREASEPSKSKAGNFFPPLQQGHSSGANTKSRLPGSSVGGSTITSVYPVQGSKPPMGASGGAGLMNFIHFSRPASAARANIQGSDKSKINEKLSVANVSTSPLESTRIEPSGARGSSALDLRNVDTRAVGEIAKRNTVCFEQSEAVCREDTTQKNHQNPGVVAKGTSPDIHTTHQSSSFAASVAVGRQQVEKGPDAIVASSSVCSGNSAGAASNDPKHKVKRKIPEEASGYHSEDLDDDSTGLKKPTVGRGGTSTKRSRAAEVHNLSERRRRDRINEKMRALQELIPNCNKVDKASMLDEAIEYLKTLQLQVQMMSMGSGLCMSPMMLPPGMQHIRAPPMAHFSPMGVGMGMGMGMGYGMGMLDMNGSPMIPVPSMHTSQFPCSSIPGTSALHGIPASTTGLQLFGIPGHGQGLPMSMPRAPLFSPLSGLATRGGPVNEASGSLVIPLPVSDAGPSSRLKDQLQQQQCINLEATHQAGNCQPQNLNVLNAVKDTGNQSK